MDREEYFLDLMEADQNDPNVQYEIGRCYLQGDGVEPDGAQAEFWLQKAADQGQEDAIALLSVPKEEGLSGTVTVENLLDWCAAAEEGDPEAQYQAAMYFREEGGPGAKQDVERYLHMAADQGHPQACTILGQELLNKNPQEAVRHLKNAADCGVPDAMNLLGQCFWEGHGTAKNEAEAQRWFEGAAERGSAEDKLNMALRFQFGEGMPCSVARAMNWLYQAQKAGMGDAKARFDAAIADRQAQQEAQEARRQQQAREAEERRQAEETRRAAEAARQEAQRREETARREAEARRQEKEIAQQAEQRYRMRLHREEAARRAREEQPWVPEEQPRSRNSFFDRAQNALLGNMDVREREELQRQIDKGLDTASGLLKKARHHGLRMAKRLQSEGILPDLITIPDEPEEQLQANQQTYTFQFNKPSLTVAAIQEQQRQEKLLEQFLEGTQIPFEDSLYSMAQEGNADAQWVLGALYFNGDYRVMNSYARFERAAYWLEKSANQGNANGQYFYGCCFAAGAGVEQNLDAAFQWWKRAAQQWHEQATDFLSRCNHVKVGNDEYHVVSINVNGFPKTDSRYTKHYVSIPRPRQEIAVLKRQVQLMERMKQENRIPIDADPIDLAKLGDADAQWLVALACYQGTCGALTGYERFEHAAFWAKKAADQGHAFAQWLYGDCLACGAGVAKDLDQALAWWKKAADQGLANTARHLNTCEFDFQDHAHLKEEPDFLLTDDYYITVFPDVPLTEENAQQESQMMQLLTPLIRGEATKVEIRKLMSLAKGGDPNAQSAVGYAYCYGKCGFPTDAEEASAWFELAARQGNKWGQFYYGNCVVNQDADEAYQWWMKAYRQGLNLAAFALRSCHFDFDDHVIFASLYGELNPVEQ